MRGMSLLMILYIMQSFSRCRLLHPSRAAYFKAIPSPGSGGKTIYRADAFKPLPKNSGS
jgi:hypothetical protein